MASQPARFSELLSSAWNHVVSRKEVLISGAVVFGVLSALLQLPQGESGPLTNIVALALVAAVVGIVVSLVANLYFLLAITKNDKTMQEIIPQTFPRILPYLGMTILIMIYSFAWIAFVGGLLMALGIGLEMPLLNMIGMLLMAAGIIAGIIYGPRYVFAPFIWIVESKNVSESIKRSYALTSGYWGKIFGNILLMGIILLPCMIVVSIIGGILGKIASMGGALVASLVTALIVTIATYCYQAFANAFLYKLTATIIANPRSAVAVK